MRLCSFVAAAALATASCAAHADSMLTETYTFSPIQGYSSESGTSFAQFNPSLGTLDSVTLNFSSRATFSGGGNRDKNHAQYSLRLMTPSGLQVYTAQALATGNGTATGDINDYTVSNYNNLFTGTGTITTELRITNKGAGAASISSTFGTETLTYNYTPAVTPVAPTPEPSSLALLGTGLFGALGILRKRFA